MDYSRRDLGKMALAGLALPSLFDRRIFAAGKPNSKINGVQIGAITYSYNRVPVDQIIKTMADEGLSEAEVMSNHVEALLGAPSGRAGGPGAGAPGGGGRGAAGAAASAPAGAQPGSFAGRTMQAPDGAAPAGAGLGPGAGAGRAGGVPGGGRGRAPLTPEQQAAQAAAAAELTKWRAALTPDQIKTVRKMFNDAGIDVRLLCFNMPSTMTDEDIEYGFRMAKALEVKAMSTTTQVSMAKRIAPFAEKYKLHVGFHGHDDTTNPDEVSSPDTFKAVTAVSSYHWINLDIGHFTAANFDAVAFIQENHARITNLHLKDRKKDHGPNVTWGTGDTPIKAVLQLLKKNKWDIPANIEFETMGQDVLQAVPFDLQFCRDALA